MINMKYPLILISQIQRSGGTLLSQLFDGHSKCLVYPGELGIGNPKWIWPCIDLNNSLFSIFKKLIDKYTVKYVLKGYTKQTSVGEKIVTNFPFNFDLTTNCNLFLEYIDNIESPTVRDIFNSYFYSYFKTLCGSADVSKTVIGFIPRLSLINKSVEDFFKVYPDGKMISILREPVGWYASMSMHASSFAKNGNLFKIYIDNINSMVINEELYNNRVIVIGFQNLINNTEQIMRNLCNFINIDFEEILLTPTFNKMEIEADSNFIECIKTGIVKEVLNRRDKLTKSKLKEVEKRLLPKYEKIRKFFQCS